VIEQYPETGRRVPAGMTNSVKFLGLWFLTEKAPTQRVL
jgi:hypothetical protein